MLKKLIHYEFRSLLRTVIPLLCAIPVLGFLAGFFLTVNPAITGIGELLGENAESFLTVLSGVLTVVAFLGIAAAAAVACFLLLARFYQNFFTDEGYLTLTLPVSVDGLLIAKFVTAFLLVLATGVALLAGALLFLGFVTEWEGNGFFSFAYLAQGWEELTKLLGELSREIGAGHVILIAAEIGINALASVVNTLSVAYLAITLGNQVAKKHRVLASLGFHFLINAGLSTVFSVVGWLPFLSVSEDTLLAFLHVFLLIALIVSLAETAGAYFLTRHLLQRPNID